MIIQMTVQMSGGRYDDRQWPPPWTNFEVTEEEGHGLVRCGAAMEVVQQSEPAPLTGGEDPQTPQVPPYVASPQSAESAATAQPASITPQEIAAAQAEHAAKTVPSPGDPKAAWVEHAVSQGMDRAEAESSTKAALQQQYGGRL
jgi:hypothetical protein